MKTSNLIATFVYILMLCACSERVQGANSKHTSATNKQANEESIVSLDACAACHGPKGISSNTDWPNLAGQQEEYLYRQLLQFKEGKRNTPLMNAGLLKSYTDEDLRSIARQYSNIETDITVNDGANELPGAHVRARCVSCHSMDGRSVTSLWPNLAGQQAGYLENQLTAYKSGVREHPTMQVIASELTEKQIKDVAEYYSKINP